VIGKESYKKSFLAYHLKFLQDPEPEMKSIACLRVEELGELMDVEDIVGKLLPILKGISTDPNGFVRSSKFKIIKNRFSGKLDPSVIAYSREEGHDG
jgi:hypothetical protein